MTSKSKGEDKSETGKTLSKILRSRKISQYSAAAASETSQPYFNQVANGRRTPSADWLNLVANALDLSEEERVKLHRAAAKDHGFDIDLD
jgi:transcriptional regulator with XRE-family HTH domain